MHVMFQCKVKADEVAHNLELLDAVYAELASVRPAGLSYVTYQLDDGVTLVAIVELADGPAVLQGLPAFQRYRADLEDRCDELPVMTVMSAVGSYRSGSDPSQFLGDRLSAAAPVVGDGDDPE